MNVLFITLGDIRSIDSHDIYADLMRMFAKNQHNVYIVSPVERRNNGITETIESEEKDYHQYVHILKIRTGNIQKVNFIEKGISIVLLEKQIIKGIRKYFSSVKFDLVLYSTPPVTIEKAVRFVKNRDGSRTYLMLKDITPQAIVDLKAMKTTGPMSLIYHYFKMKENMLYAVSDMIGCMSEANVDYILNNHKDIMPNKVEVCPNCIEVIDGGISVEEKIRIRKEYSIPADKKVFVYGGNLGKPQDIDYIIKCLSMQAKDEDTYFLIIGDGTEFKKLSSYISESESQNVKLIKRLPKSEYDKLVSASDVGLVFLDHRFTVPNIPSRLLGYMQAHIPVIACTDKVSDVGRIISENEFGWWCESNDPKRFNELVETAVHSDLRAAGERAYQVLLRDYQIDRAYSTITK